ncbi:disease resistance At4g27190-like [Olea europaea subsp. europaea]|uniref:Disease resistance At4g27190-like n=1 Tax=Olea europaea subsp. europaea TaxID=158383 RepID=A0A8S0R8E3_OLEEU|nr:disease resistance At4g27190-like [Olea europaea subsp. europaea]
MLKLTPLEDFKTRLSIKMKIKEVLKDKDISTIGICGMPGVGKTTMANEIANEVKFENLFEEVAFVVVSNYPDIIKIQDQLCDMLGLKIEEKTNKSLRAQRLQERLECSDGKNILVILDDVWEEIDLGTIGIPSPHDHKGLKIMFTTRIEEMCSKMEAQRKFEIKVLNEKEGWQLFKDMTGISDDEIDVELESIARKVADECGCLPLALEVVGKALKNKKDTHKLRDALQQLRKSSATNLEGMENIVYKSIRLSYNYLGSENRDLLLLCSLFAEDESISIENLVRYAKGLVLFPNTDTLNETRGRAYSIVLNLKSCYLLQPGEEEDEVKLHCVIRAFCLQMATRDKCGYLVKHAGLTEWPEHDADESCSAISITFDKLGQLPGGLKYQNVKLLRVICRELGECNISKEFFKDIKELRVLELKGMYIQIPSSIQLLMGLRTLCLTDCKVRSQLSMIGILKKLEILSFYHSSIGDYFPIELANLSNLRSLDLRFSQFSCPLRSGVLSGMKKLEELYLGCSIPIESEDRRHIIEKELSSLTSLHTFQISTLNPILTQILKTPCLKNLEKFQILGTTAPRGGIEDQYFTRSWSLEDGIDASMLLQPAFNLLMKRTYHLHIKADTVLKNLVSELDGNGFINLKTLKLSRGNFEYLIDATNSIPSDTFGKLESLELKGLPNLTEICNGVFKPPLFCNLTSVKMYVCDAIRSLFRESVAKCLVNFPNMEELNVFHLDCIVKLLGKEIPITSLRKLTTMSLYDCVELLTIAESDSIQLLQNLEHLYVVRCYALKVVFDFEGIKVTNNDAENNMLGRLGSLWLDSLPELVHITRRVPKGIWVFQNLTDLRVGDCKRIIYLFSPSVANFLVALQVLHVSDCESIEEIIGKEEDDEEEEEEGNSKIMFPKLCDLLLVNLQNIQMFCSRNYELVFPSMTSLIVRRCPMMKKLSPLPLNASKLSKYKRQCVILLDIPDLLDEAGN